MVDKAPGEHGWEDENSKPPATSAFNVNSIYWTHLPHWSSLSAHVPSRASRPPCNHVCHHAQNPTTLMTFSRWDFLKLKSKKLITLPTTTATAPTTTATASTTTATASTTTATAPTTTATAPTTTATAPEDPLPSSPTHSGAVQGPLLTKWAFLKMKSKKMATPPTPTSTQDTPTPTSTATTPTTTSLTESRAVGYAAQPAKGTIPKEKGKREATAPEPTSPVTYVEAVKAPVCSLSTLAQLAKINTKKATPPTATAPTPSSKMTCADVATVPVYSLSTLAQLTNGALPGINTRKATSPTTTAGGDLELLSYSKGVGGPVSRILRALTEGVHVGSEVLLPQRVTQTTQEWLMSDIEMLERIATECAEWLLEE